MSDGFEISGYTPGALADVVRLHMAYYSTNWGFGLAFETKVASELSGFLRRFNSDNDLFLVACKSGGECIGSISLDSQDSAGEGAHIRWFIVNQELVGRGIGRILLTNVIDHCHQCGIARIYLTTFEGLHAARKLYESFGFELTEERDVDQWAGGVKEQLFVREKGQNPIRRLVSARLV